jgi:hypothetical protein
MGGVEKHQYETKMLLGLQLHFQGGHSSRMYKLAALLAW